MGPGERRKKQFDIDNQGFFEYAPTAATNIPDDFIDDPFLDDGFELFNFGEDSNNDHDGNSYSSSNSSNSSNNSNGNGNGNNNSNSSDNSNSDSFNNNFGDERFRDTGVAAEIIMDGDVSDLTNSKGYNSLDGINAKKDFSASSDSNQKSQDICNLKSSRKSRDIYNVKSPSSFFDDTNKNVNSALLDLLETILPKITKTTSKQPDNRQDVNKNVEINSIIDKLKIAKESHPWFHGAENGSAENPPKEALAGNACDFLGDSSNKSFVDAAGDSLSDTSGKSFVDSAGESPKDLSIEQSAISPISKVTTINPNLVSSFPVTNSNPKASFFENSQESRANSCSYDDFEIFRDFSFLSLDSKRKFFLQATQYAKMKGTVQQEVHFSAYYPQYSVMNAEQLNWYFYWRDNVRNRIFIKTDSSYVFLYFYELIHLVGYKSSKEALDQILFVWKEARYKNSSFDPYLVVWIRDFILYYGENLEYYAVLEDVLGDMTGKYLYQECILYFVEGERKSGILHALEKLSDYPVTEGHFYKNGYASFLEDCICEVLLKFNEKYLAKEGQNFLFALCGKFMRDSAFKPFASAIFYEQGKMNNERSQRLNSKVVYTLSSPVIGSTLIPGLNEIKKLRKFVTGLLRTVESLLRELTAYRWSIKKGKLSKSNLLMIEKEVQSFYNDYLAEKKRKERKVFRVNDDILLKLKVDSQHIREHLISVQELSNKLCEEPSEEISRIIEIENNALNQEVSRITEVKNNSSNDQNVLGEIVLARKNIASSEEDIEKIKNLDLIGIMPNSADFRYPKNLSACQHLRPHGSRPHGSKPTGSESPFVLFIGQLSPGQREILTSITRMASLDELRQIASTSNTFLNVIIEEINELALDNIGDCIIDSSSNSPGIYEDYLSEILSALEI